MCCYRFGVSGRRRCHVFSQMHLAFLLCLQKLEDFFHQRSSPRLSRKTGYSAASSCFTSVFQKATPEAIASSLKS